MTTSVMIIDDELFLAGSDCGANAPGGGGFQPGNTCGKGGSAMTPAQRKYYDEYARVARMSRKQILKELGTKNDKNVGTYEYVEALVARRLGMSDAKARKTYESIGDAIHKIDVRDELPAFRSENATTSSAAPDWRSVTRYDDKTLVRRAYQAGESMFSREKGHGGYVGPGKSPKIIFNRLSDLAKSGEYVDEFEHVFYPSTGKGRDVSSVPWSRARSSWADVDGLIYTASGHGHIKVVDPEGKFKKRRDASLSLADDDTTLLADDRWRVAAPGARIYKMRVGTPKERTAAWERLNRLGLNLTSLEQLPVFLVHPRMIRTTQPDMEQGKVDRMIYSDDLEPGMAIQIDGKIYLLDGHHRCAARVERGEKLLPLHVRWEGDYPIGRAARFAQRAPDGQFTCASRARELGHSMTLSEDVGAVLDELSLAFCPTGEGGGVDNSCPPANALGGAAPGAVDEWRSEDDEIVFDVHEPPIGGSIFDAEHRDLTPSEVRAQEKKFAGRLTNDERDVLFNYAAMNHINDVLRSGDALDRDAEDVMREVHVIDGAIMKGALPRDTVLYRVMSLPSGNDLTSLDGETISDRAYLSTSTDKSFYRKLAADRADEEDENRGYELDYAVWKITAPEGAHAAFVGDVVDASHREVLLPRNAKMFVHGVKELKGRDRVAGRKTYEIEAELVPDKSQRRGQMELSLAARVADIDRRTRPGSDAFFRRHDAATARLAIWRRAHEVGSHEALAAYARQVLGLSTSADMTNEEVLDYIDLRERGQLARDAGLDVRDYIDDPSAVSAIEEILDWDADEYDDSFDLSLADPDSSDCGANAPGGGGFQPGNTCGSTRRSAYTVESRPDPHAIAAMRDVDESFTPSRLAELVGAPKSRNTYVYIERSGYDGPNGEHGVKVIVRQDNAFRMDRIIYRDNETGKLVCKNENFRVEAQGRGLGAQMFAMQVDQMSRAGFSKITTNAARWSGERDAFVGYKVWPKMGYDGELPRDTMLRLKSSGGALAGAKTIQELYSKPGGREWWEINGTDIDLEFDLREGSNSRRILDAYLDKKHGRAA